MSNDKIKIFTISRPEKEWEEMLLCAEFTHKLTGGKKGLSEFVGFLFDFWKTSTLGSGLNVNHIEKLLDSRAANKGHAKG